MYGIGIISMPTRQYLRQLRRRKMYIYKVPELMRYVSMSLVPVGEADPSPVLGEK